MEEILIQIINLIVTGLFGDGLPTAKKKRKEEITDDIYRLDSLEESHERINSNVPRL